MSPLPDFEPSASTPPELATEARLRLIVREELCAALRQPVEPSTPATRPDAALLTARETAALLRVDERTLRRLVREAAIPEPLHIGRRALRWDARGLYRALGLEG